MLHATVEQLEQVIVELKGRGLAGDEVVGLADTDGDGLLASVVVEGDETTETILV